MEAKGLHKSGKCSLGRAGHREALQGTLVPSAAVSTKQRWVKPAEPQLRARRMSPNLPLPQQQPWVPLLLGQRSSFASANLFFLPSTLWMHWVHAGGLGDLSSHRWSHGGVKTTTATETLTMAPEHLCCSAARRGDSPLCSLQIA